MKKAFNHRFNELWMEYNLSDEVVAATPVSRKLKKMLSEEIRIEENIIHVPPFGKLWLTEDLEEELSDREDTSNHFHVDSFAVQSTEEMIFRLAIKVLNIIAEKLQAKAINGVRCWLTFETKAMSEQFARDNNLPEVGDEYGINERLSFFFRRENQSIVEVDKHYSRVAVLIIDI